MLVPIQMGTNMAAGNQQKHLPLSFVTKNANLSLEELKNVTLLLFSNTRTVQIANRTAVSTVL